MRSELEILEKIDCYLRGEMSTVDHTAFKQEIALNPELKSKVKQQEVLIQAIERQALSKQIKAVSGKKGFGKFKVGLSVLSIAVLTMLGLYFWNSNQELNVHENQATIIQPEIEPESKIEFSEEEIIEEEVVEDLVEEQFAEEEILEETNTIPIQDEEHEIAEEPLEEKESLVIESENTYNIEEIQEDDSDDEANESRIKLNILTESNIVKPEEPEISNLRLNSEAEFPGGEGEMVKYIEDYLISYKGRIPKGIIEIEFIVNKDGSLSDIKVIQGVSRKINAEAIELVKSMPKWTPAMRNGKPISAYNTIPIELQLRE